MFVFAGEIISVFLRGRNWKCFSSREKLEVFFFAGESGSVFFSPEKSEVFFFAGESGSIFFRGKN